MAILESISELPHPASLGKYRIISSLGRGGMGVVYLAEDTSLGRQVAIKVLPASLGADPEFTLRFKQEARVAASLSHPNIVHIHAFEMIQGSPVIEMEFVDGGSLADLMKQQYLSPGAILRMVRDVALGLAYCHDLGAIHLDVKPANILLDQTGRALLADFGIARVVSEAERIALSCSHSGIFRGTPFYAPPEAWEGARPTEKWDIYALGVILYEGIAGSPPYTAATPLALAKMIATTKAPRLSELGKGVSGELCDLVDCMTHGDPDERLESVDTFLERLKTVPECKDMDAHANETVVVRQVSARGAKRTKRNARGSAQQKRIAVALVATVLSLLVFALLWLRPAKQDLQFSSSPSGLSEARALENAGVEAPPLLAPENSTAPGSGGSGVVLESVYADGEAGTWLIDLDDGGHLASVLWYDANQITRMTGTPDEASGYRVQGNWAGYGDDKGTIFHWGSVEGALNWISASRVLTGTLEYLSEEDGLITTVAIAAHPHPALLQPSRVVQEMEQSEFILPLLYQELLPRGAEWALPLERLFPSMPYGRILAPRLDPGHLDTLFQPDALTREALWADLSPLPGVAQPDALSSGADPQGTMRVAYSGSELLLAVECDWLTTAGSPVLELFVLSRFTVPLSSAPHFQLEYDHSTGELNSRYRDQPLFGADRGQILPAITGPAWSALCRIPFSSLGIGSGEAVQGQRWRISARLSILTEGGQRLPYMSWGSAAQDPVYLGALIELTN